MNGMMPIARRLVREGSPEWTEMVASEAQKVDAGREGNTQRISLCEGKIGVFSL
jgi:hypothetical protein